MYYIALTGIERNMPEIVGQYLSSMYKLTKGVCYEINNSVTHPAGDFPYRVARDVDGFVLRCFAASMKNDLCGTHINSAMSTALVHVIATSSPTFTWLIHAIAAWQSSKDTMIMIRMQSDIKAAEHELIYLLSTVVILQQLHKQKKYCQGIPSHALVHLDSIREFSKALVDNQAWITSHQEKLKSYIEDINGEINSWLVTDVATLAASFSHISSQKINY